MCFINLFYSTPFHVIIQGDSGGPMHCYKDGVWYAAGITSWGIVTCRTLPPVYTRISKYWEWIVTNMLANPPPGLHY